MSASLYLTPAGRLRLEEAPASLPAVGESEVTTLRAALDESSAAGLVLLATKPWGGDLPASLAFWLGFARDFFHAICRLGEDAIQKWKSAPPPSDEQLAQLIADAPPMRGLECLTEDLLHRLWRELAEAATDRAMNFPEGPAAWLQAINPLWHLLGRVGGNRMRKRILLTTNAITTCNTPTCQAQHSGSDALSLRVTACRDSTQPSVRP